MLGKSHLKYSPYECLKCQINTSIGLFVLDLKIFTQNIKVNKYSSNIVVVKYSHEFHKLFGDVFESNFFTIRNVSVLINLGLQSLNTSTYAFQFIR